MLSGVLDRESEQVAPDTLSEEDGDRKVDTSVGEKKERKVLE